MKLIANPTSPYSRKVRIVLAEKRIDYEFVVDNPGDATTLVPDYNPLGKIPVLILDDETTLFDSRVIVEYLDSASPVGRLIPDDTRHRIQVRIEGFNIGGNVGEVAGQTVGHAHIHLIPRRRGDTPNPRGGVRGVIPDQMGYETAP